MLCTVDRLQAGCAVNVRDRGYPIAPSISYEVVEQHIGVGHTWIERLRGEVLQADRRHRPVALTQLHVVEPVFHLRIARGGEDAAVAQRTRAKFSAAVEHDDRLWLFGE